MIINYKFSGDISRHKEYLPRVNLEMEELVNGMKFQDLQQDYRRRVLDDGTTILCKSLFGQNYAEVHIPEKIELPPEDQEIKGREYVIIALEHLRYTGDDAVNNPKYCIVWDIKSNDYLYSEPMLYEDERVQSLIGSTIQSTGIYPLMKLEYTGTVLSTFTYPLPYVYADAENAEEANEEILHVGYDGSATESRRTMDHMGIVTPFEIEAPEMTLSGRDVYDNQINQWTVGIHFRQTSGGTPDNPAGTWAQYLWLHKGFSLGGEDVWKWTMTTEEAEEEEG